MASSRAKRASSWETERRMVAQNPWFMIVYQGFTKGLEGLKEFFFFFMEFIKGSKSFKRVYTLGL